MKKRYVRYIGLFVVSTNLLFTAPVGAVNGGTELINVDFDDDIPGQPPSTGGPGEPVLIQSPPGTSVLVEASANGITTQPVVLTVPTANEFATIAASFPPVSQGVVRVEATVGFDRLADGYFLQTTAGSGPFPFAVVTRLITRDFAQIQDNETRTNLGTYTVNQPFRIRMDINMSTDTWSVAVDNEMNGFNDDATVSNLPFTNPPSAAPTVGSVWGSLNLFPTSSVAPTSVAYDDIRVVLLGIEVNIDIKPGGSPNSINSRSHGLIPVAVLSSSGFNAPAVVKKSSVKFGRTGSETSLAFCNASGEDVNFDGLLDLVCHFFTQETGFQVGDVLGTLTGETVSGTAIIGTDSVRIVR